MLTVTRYRKYVGAFALLLLLNGCAGGDGTEAPAPQPPHEPITVPPPPVPPPSTLVTWDFHGHLADGGTVDGSFTYDTTEAPRSENFQALEENRVYNLTAWRLVVLPTVEAVMLTFDSTKDGDVSGLCVGHCLFSPSLLERVFFSNATAKLALVFSLPETVVHDAIPSTLDQWGPFAPDASRLDGVDFTVFRFTELLTQGTISAHVETK